MKLLFLPPFPNFPLGALSYPVLNQGVWFRVTPCPALEVGCLGNHPVSLPPPAPVVDTGLPRQNQWEKRVDLQTWERVPQVSSLVSGVV